MRSPSFGEISWFHYTYSRRRRKPTDKVQSFSGRTFFSFCFASRKFKCRKTWKTRCAQCRFGFSPRLLNFHLLFLSFHRHTRLTADPNGTEMREAKAWWTTIDSFRYGSWFFRTIACCVCTHFPQQRQTGSMPVFLYFLNYWYRIKKFLLFWTVFKKNWRNNICLVPKKLHYGYTYRNQFHASSISSDTECLGG